MQSLIKNNFSKYIFTYKYISRTGIDLLPTELKITTKPKTRSLYDRALSTPGDIRKYVP
jgi:hypothetical protein